MNPMEQSSTHHAIGDRCGICLSAACAVHCTAAPIILLALPRIGGIWAHPASHAIMAVLVLPLALRVVFGGFRRHRKLPVLIATVLGGVFIGAGAAIPYLEFPSAPAAETSESAASTDGCKPCASCCPHIEEDEEGESSIIFPPASIVTTIGSLLLIGGHLGNLLARKERCAHGPP